MNEGVNVCPCFALEAYIKILTVYQLCFHLNYVAQTIVSTEVGGTSCKNCERGAEVEVANHKQNQLFAKCLKNRIFKMMQLEKTKFN